jgi:integrase/recombinase XerD
LEVPLSDTAVEIISQYAEKNGNNDSDYIFPIVASDILGDPEKEWLRITDARKFFNINLKKLAKLAGLDVNLTSYVVRHSWASIAKFSGISTVVIGESLGHSDLKTTETYLAEFEHDVLDEANDLIVS